jgi:putative nucleotidyltransferase with HDIG domain
MAGVINMSVNKVYFSVFELKPGMVTAEEVRVGDTVLINADIPLTEAAIIKLKEKYYLNRISIYADESVKNIRIEDDTRSVEEIEQSFTEYAFNVQEIFENIQDLQVSGIEEVRSFSKRIQNELKSTNAVIKNIVLYGSGSDTIYRHSVNVAALSSIMARWLGFKENEISLITYAAILHDFGKIKINQDILNKPGPLNAKEFKEIKSHPVVGYNFIKEIPYLDSSVSLGVLMHHERMDGSGYPLGMKEDKIHPFAKIVSIADVFDAVNSNRVYKKSTGPFEALEIIKKESLGKLDYKYCNVFLNHVVNYYMGENIMLNNNKICKIIQVDVNNLARPLILDENTFIDLKHEKNLYIEKLVL